MFVIHKSSDSAHAAIQQQLKDWMTRLYSALGNSESYTKLHMGFFREFKQLSDKVHGSTKHSIVPYVKAVFNHMASQGYQPHIHYDTLFQGMSVYCQNLPPPTWVPPPNQFNRSPTPTLQALPPPPTAVKKSKASSKPTHPPQLEPRPSLMPIGPPKGKAKANKATPTEKPHKEPPPARNKPAAKAKASTKVTKVKPSAAHLEDTTDGEYNDGTSNVGNPEQQREAVKHTNCMKEGHPCLVNPATINNVFPACLKCFTGK